MDGIRVPARCLDVRVGFIKGNTVLVAGRKAYQLSSVGAEIWKRCDGETRVDEIARQIADKYQISKEAAEQDVRKFLASLSGRRLVEESDG